MATGRLWIAAAALVLPGCLVAVGEFNDAPYGWTVRRETSMLPHFPGDDTDTYPIVVVHQHVAESEREQEEYRTGKRPRVVCFTLDDLEPAPVLGASESMDSMAACMPGYDAGTGRLFVAKEEFAQWDPWAIAVIGAGCGHSYPLQESSPGLVVDGPRHRFRVEFLKNETLRVDDWYVEPGESLKVDYWDPGRDAGARDDDRAVTYAFDYPGRWLRSRVGPWDENEQLPPRPTEGDGPEAWLPREPQHVSEILTALQAASHDSPTDLGEFRMTMVRGKITDLSVVVAGKSSTRWFVAGGNDDKVRMLGATVSEPPVSRVPLEEFLRAFDSAPIGALAGPTDYGATLDLRWEPGRGLRSIMPIPWSETWLPENGTCGASCRFVWAQDAAGEASWRSAQRTQSASGENQLTLVVRITDGSGERERLFFRPA